MPASDVALPLDRLPIDILHVSDTHFCGVARRSRRQHWAVFLDHVAGAVASSEFAPALIAFTGDLIQTPGTPAARLAFRRGVAALLDLCVACRFIPSRPPEDTWGTDYPDVWWQVLNRRLLIVPGNHDVFFSGLRMGYQQFRGGWRTLAAPSGTRPADSVEIGPLAVRLIDSNGGPALAKRARGVYDAAGNSTASWPFAETRHFPVALLHGHPVQLPFLIEGIASEAGMMVDNAGSLLRDLASLGVRLVLHGHRHLPNVCGIVIHNHQGDPHHLTIVGAPSPTDPAAQWPFFGYYRIRIEPDRRVVVRLMRRAHGQRHFDTAESTPQSVQHGDFEYDETERHVTVTEAGDECNTIRVRGFRIRHGAPPVHSIPFTVVTHDAATLAATRFTAARAGTKPAPQLTWDREHKVIRIEPPHTDAHDPLDLEFHYCIHNGSPRSGWDARQLGLSDARQDAVSERRMCASRRAHLRVTLPRALAAIGSDAFTVEAVGPDGKPASVPVAWDAGAMTANVTIDRPRIGSVTALRWRLPDGTPSAREEGAIQATRAWQAALVRGLLAPDTARPLDAACDTLTALAMASLGERPDTGIFLVCSTEVLERLEGLDVRPGLLLAGERAAVHSSGRVRLAYGEGVVGRAARTGRVVSFNRLIAEETAREYTHGDRTEAPLNYAARIADDRKYDAILAVPIACGRVTADPPPPSTIVLVATLATKDAKSALVQAADDRRIRALAEEIRDAMRALLERLVSEQGANISR